MSNTYKSSLHYRENCSTVLKNFTNWQDIFISFIFTLLAKRPAILLKKTYQICFLVNLMKFSRKYFHRGLCKAQYCKYWESFKRLGHIFCESFSVFWSSVFVFSSRFYNITITFSIATAGCLVSLTDLFFSYWPRFFIWKDITQQYRETPQE